jgi:hypothetical protein
MKQKSVTKKRSEGCENKSRIQTNYNARQRFKVIPAGFEGQSFGRGEQKGHFGQIKRNCKPDSVCVRSTNVARLARFILVSNGATKRLFNLEQS